MNDKHRIVIVGGGAGGLELATRLGKKLGRRGRAEITLVDASRTHIWKPLLHEVAAGTFDSYENQLEYLAQGARNGFHFRLGRMDSLDREKRQIQIAPTYSSEGEEIIPRRTFGYDTLVIAVGSISNDFGIPGVKEHCLFLDTKAQAEQFQTRLLESHIHAHAQDRPLELSQLDIVIAGGGATGIELAAQLHKVSRLFRAYGLETITPNAIQISVVEAADRILPGLPERLSRATREELGRLGIDVITGQRVTEVTEQGVHTDSGQFIPAAIKVWAAGIKAPDFLREIAGLETTRSNQLVVRPTLQTTRDDAVFALGDCAACPWPEKDSLVPPRAQAAHQQASHLYRVLRQRLNNEPLSEYHYRDYGSLVSLGRYSTVGNLMGNLTGSVMVEGFIARMVYLSLYKLHQLALFGFYRTALLSISHLFRAGVHPEIKLH